MLHVICTRLRLGHLRVRVGDSSRRCEEIVKKSRIAPLNAIIIIKELKSACSHTMTSRVTTLPWTWRDRISTRGGWSGVRTLPLGQMVRWICDFYLSVAARTVDEEFSLGVNLKRIYISTVSSDDMHMNKRSVKSRGRYHGDQRPSSDDRFHSPAVIPPSALDKPSITKRYHRRRTCSHISPRRSQTMVTLHDTRFVEWNDGWTVKTVVTLTVVGLHDTGPRIASESRSTPSLTLFCRSQFSGVTYRESRILVCQCLLVSQFILQHIFCKFGMRFT